MDKQNSRNSGRKIGSRNKLSTKAKENLLELFEDNIKQLHKSINYVSPDERFVRLKPIIKLLCTGNDEISNNTRNLIYESLKSEFTKTKFYLNQLPSDKRASELRQYMSYLNKEQIENIFGSIKR
ncbi:hypothetical protein QWZ06_23545 [Chryseobacterium tructae]|uniref:hypothetical protein n=1 Tax=Chryseobacterium tructae TaxID=1037380 RepID=UPI0025B41078|nr:hypothetical protein [Chryseobacterium tructae]MDN3694995.1 hypothetical protein [Chryseobacterium tructae]